MTKTEAKSLATMLVWELEEELQFHHTIERMFDRVKFAAIRNAIQDVIIQHVD